MAFAVPRFSAFRSAIRASSVTKPAAHRNTLAFRIISPSSYPDAVRTLSTHGMTISEAVMSDHRDIDLFADEYRRSRGNPSAQASWGNQLIWTIARHSVGEEIAIYPLFQEYFGARGDQVAQEDRAYHQSIKERLFALEKLKPGTLKYDHEFESAMDIMETFMDREATEDLPMLEDALGPDKSKEAASKFVRAKKLAPTRPHPDAPDQPPVESVFGFLQMPIDKLKDQFTKFPTEEMLAESAKHIH